MGSTRLKMRQVGITGYTVILKAALWRYASPAPELPASDVKSPIYIWRTPGVAQLVATSAMDTLLSTPEVSGVEVEDTEVVLPPPLDALMMKLVPTCHTFEAEDVAKYQRSREAEEIAEIFVESGTLQYAFSIPVEA